MATLARTPEHGATFPCLSAATLTPSIRRQVQEPGPMVATWPSLASEVCGDYAVITAEVKTGWAHESASLVGLPPHQPLETNTEPRCGPSHPWYRYWTCVCRIAADLLRQIAQ